MDKVTFYLKEPHLRAAVCNGGYAKVLEKKDEPLACSKDEWERILEPTGLFTRQRPVKTKQAERRDSSASPQNDNKEA